MSDPIPLLMPEGRLQRGGEDSPRRYRIVHETDYRYDSPVALSQQLLHLTPRILSWQHCLESQLEVEPRPTVRLERWDAFGNPVTQLAFDTPHDRLLVRASTLLEVQPHTLPTPPAHTPAWEAVRERLIYQGAEPPQPEDLDACRYLYESAYVRTMPVFAAYAADCFPPACPILAGAVALMGKIYREFEFDAGATTVTTPVDQVLAHRRGVCQDFAHLMLSCLRSLGLAARYVSGYLLTDPPPGSPRLVGADASHAWVSLYCPDIGWVDLDPTNDLIPDTRHITLAWGRDFGDVTPMRGVILGGGTQELEVRVTVHPVP